MDDLEMSWDEVAAHLVGLAHLATASAAGGPAVAIVSPVVDGADIWAMARRGSTKARNVAERGDVALVWQSDGEVYVWGEAAIVDSVEEKRQRWSTWHYDAAGFFGAPERDDVVMLRIRPRRATVLAAGPDGPRRGRWVDPTVRDGNPSRIS